MANISDPKILRKFDKRTVRRNIKRGIVSNDDYKAFVAALPDVAGNVAPPEPLEEAPQRPAPAPSMAPPPAVAAADPLPGTPVSPDALGAVTGTPVIAPEGDYGFGGGDSDGSGS